MECNTRRTPNHRRKEIPAMAKTGRSERRFVSQETALQMRIRAWIAEDAAWGKAENDLEVLEWDARASVPIPDCIRQDIPADEHRGAFTRAMPYWEIEALTGTPGHAALVKASAEYEAAVNAAMVAAGVATKRAEHEAWDERRYEELRAIRTTPATCPADVLAKLELANVFGMWDSEDDLEDGCILAVMRDLRTLAGIPQPKRWRYYPEPAPAQASG